MDNWHKIFIARLSELKRTEGMTQAKLAELLELSQGAIASWIKGTHEPRNVRQFRALEKAIRLPAGTLTQAPGESKNGEAPRLSLANSNNQPYTPSIDPDAIEKAVEAVMNELGFDGMKMAGPKACAQILTILYDIFSDPAANQLSNDTIIRIIKNKT